MKIGIIGAGITGLTAAYELTKKNHEVVVFEKAPHAGGLGTYLEVGGRAIERFYHHFFESDKYVIALIKELGIQSKLHFYRATTGIYLNNKIYPFSGPIDLLRFVPMSLVNRLRLGISLAYLKYLPVDAKYLDNIPAHEWLKKYAGDEAYRVIWEPLLTGKFDIYATHIPALWLRERVRDRTFRLGYLDEGAKSLFDALIQKIQQLGGALYFNQDVKSVRNFKKYVEITTSTRNYRFDACLITTVSPIASQIIKNDVSTLVRNNLEKQDQLGAVCLILELRHPIQNQYWLNICNRTEPVLVMVEHTNLIDRKFYKNRTIVYLANYIHRSDPRFSLSDEEIIQNYSSFLKKVNSRFQKSWIIKAHVSRVPRAQTIFYPNSLTSRPAIEIINGRIYMGNIDQMYPHDRNFNLGVELGRRAANAIMNKSI